MKILLLLVPLLANGGVLAQQQDQISTEAVANSIQQLERVTFSDYSDEPMAQADYDFMNDLIRDLKMVTERQELQRRYRPNRPSYGGHAQHAGPHRGYKTPSSVRYAGGGYGGGSVKTHRPSYGHQPSYGSGYQRDSHVCPITGNRVYHGSGGCPLLNHFLGGHRGYGKGGGGYGGGHGGGGYPAPAPYHARSKRQAPLTYKQAIKQAAPKNTRGHQRGPKIVPRQTFVGPQAPPGLRKVAPVLGLNLDQQPAHQTDGQLEGSGLTDEDLQFVKELLQDLERIQIRQRQLRNDVRLKNRAVHEAHGDYPPAPPRPQAYTDTRHRPQYAAQTDYGHQPDYGSYHQGHVCPLTGYGRSHATHRCPFAPHAYGGGKAYGGYAHARSKRSSHGKYGGGGGGGYGGRGGGGGYGSGGGGGYKKPRPEPHVCPIVKHFMDNYMKTYHKPDSYEPQVIHVDEYGPPTVSPYSRPHSKPYGKQPTARPYKQSLSLDLGKYGGQPPSPAPYVPTHKPVTSYRQSIVTLPPVIHTTPYLYVPSTEGYQTPRPEPYRPATVAPPVYTSRPKPIYTTSYYRTTPSWKPYAARKSSNHKPDCPAYCFEPHKLPRAQAAMCKECMMGYGSTRTTRKPLSSANYAASSGWNPFRQYVSTTPSPYRKPSYGSGSPSRTIAPWLPRGGTEGRKTDNKPYFSVTVNPTRIYNKPKHTVTGPYGRQPVQVNIKQLRSTLDWKEHEQENEHEKEKEEIEENLE